MFVLFVCFIFNFLSRKSDGGAIMGQILTRLGAVDLRVFWFDSLDFFKMICCLFEIIKQTNHRKEPDPNATTT